MSDDPALIAVGNGLYIYGQPQMIQWSDIGRGDTWSTTQAPTLLSYAHALAQQAADTHRSPYSLLARAGSSTYLAWRRLSLHLQSPAGRSRLP